MPTPAFTPVSKNFTLNYVATNILTWNIIDTAGAPVDLTGYSAQLNARATSNSNQYYAANEIGSHGTWTYGADGVLKLTLPLWQTQYFSSLQNAYSLLLSNDSGTTFQLAGTGTINVNNNVI